MYQRGSSMACTINNGFYQWYDNALSSIGDVFNYSGVYLLTISNSPVLHRLLALIDDNGESLQPDRATGGAAAVVMVQRQLIGYGPVAMDRLWSSGDVGAGLAATN